MAAAQPVRAFDVLVNGTRLHVEETGAGPRTVLFSHGLFLTQRLFDAPVAALAASCRCISYDHRGQGASEGGHLGHPSDVERLYDDAVALLHRLGVTSCHWAGQSLGSFVGMRLAARRPDLVRSLVLLSPRIRRNPRSFLLRADTLCLALMGAHPFRAADAAVRQRVTDQVMREMLGPTFMSDPSRAEARAAFRADLSARLIPAAVPGIRGGIRYLENSRQMLAQIKAPTLIIAGEEDYSSGSGVQHAREVLAAITGSRLLTVAGAGHSLVIEQPEIVSDAVRDFILETGDGREGLEASS